MLPCDQSFVSLDDPMARWPGPATVLATLPDQKPNLSVCPSVQLYVCPPAHLALRPDLADGVVIVSRDTGRWVEEMPPHIELQAAQTALLLIMRRSWQKAGEVQMPPSFSQCQAQCISVRRQRM
jgi:hypothetical protein